MDRIGCVLRQAVRVACVLGALCLPGTARADCEETTLATALSPEKDIEAIVVQYLCADGFFTTAIADAVYVVDRGARPSDQDIVLVVDEGGRSENRPVLRWVGNKQLQLILERGSHTSKRKESLRGVDVLVSFDKPAR